MTGALDSLWSLSLGSHGLPTCVPVVGVTSHVLTLLPHQPSPALLINCIISYKLHVVTQDEFALKNVF